MLRELIAPTVSISVPMAAAFLDEEAALVELTREQSMLLAQLRRNKRMAVYGCAGSGKTTLAVEHAKRFANAGQDVLFTCFNAALAKHHNATEKHERIDFRTFHSLCTWQAHRGDSKSRITARSPRPSTGATSCPTSSSRRWPSRGHSGIALIVDEAEDLHDHWLAALRLTLRDGTTHRSGSSSTTTSGSTTRNSPSPGLLRLGAYDELPDHAGDPPGARQAVR